MLYKIHAQCGDYWRGHLELPLPYLAIWERNLVAIEGRADGFWQ